MTKFRKMSYWLFGPSSSAEFRALIIASNLEDIGLTGVVSEWDEQEAETTDKAMAPAAVVGAIVALAGGGGASGKGGDDRVRVTVW